MKTYLKLAGTLIVLGTFAACSNETETDADSDPTEGLDEIEIAGELEPITFSLFAADNNPSWSGMDTPIGKEIYKQTGVALDADFALSDPTERISLFAASGDYPDFILPKGDGNLLVDAGAMVDLRPLIEEHGPNIQKVYGEYLERMVLGRGR